MRVRVTVFPGDDPIADTDEWLTIYRVILTDQMKTPEEICKLVADDIAAGLRELERRK